MSASRDPLSRHLVAMHEAVGDRNLRIRSGGQNHVFACHNGSATNERLGVHTILDHGMLRVVMLQLIRIPRRLVGEMLVVQLDMLRGMGILVWMQRSGRSR